MSSVVPVSSVPTEPSADADAPSSSTFADLGVSPQLLQDLTRAGLKTPTPIQAKAIPAALEGRDVLGCAQTGTGKTAAFVIPMIERLAQGSKGPPRALVLAPTRELAFQITETIDKLGRSRRVFATTIVGGSDMHAQIRGLRQRPQILVATPGRLLDHMWQGTIQLNKLQIDHRNASGGIRPHRAEPRQRCDLARDSRGARRRRLGDQRQKAVQLRAASRDPRHGVRAHQRRAG